MTPRTRRRLLGSVLVGLLLAPPLHAQTLRVGVSAAITSMDPHFHLATPNMAAAAHIYDRLVSFDEASRIVPGLAESWRPDGETAWLFTLRPGVTFHDGTPLTPEDIVASFVRAPAVPNSPSGFGIVTSNIASIEVVDARTLRIRTRSAHPLLPNDVAQINIIRASLRGASTADFNAGRAAIGTGPYRFVAWAPGDRLSLERNPGWWGGQTPWATTELRILSADPTRVAALLAGDVDIIENVPPSDVERLSRTAGIGLTRTTSARLMYLALDQGREPAPFVTSADRQPAVPNPLKDARVRRALSLAIDRQALAERLLLGEAEPTLNVVPPGLFGHEPALLPPAANLAEARRLLAEAGFAGGFGLTLHAPNDRFVSDERVAQAIGQMFTRIGVRTQVEALPWTVFAPRASRLEFGAMLVGANSITGEASGILRLLLATFDRETGAGPLNRGRYSNPEFDRLLGTALATLDDAAREGLLRDAARLAMADVGIVPLYFQKSVWGHRATVRPTPRADEQTLAHFVALAR